MGWFYPLGRRIIILTRRIRRCFRRTVGGCRRILRILWRGGGESNATCRGLNECANSHLSIDDVLKSGKAHGAQPEDIFGCFYFHVSAELHTFVKRLKEWKIAFYVTLADAALLPSLLETGKLASWPTKFDRIEVSNIFDPNYLGVAKVVEAWGPLLNETEWAVLLGGCQNWPMARRDGRAAELRGATLDALMGKVVERLEVRSVAYLFLM